MDETVERLTPSNKRCWLPRLVPIAALLAIAIGIWYVARGGSGHVYTFRYGPPDGLQWTKSERWSTQESCVVHGKHVRTGTARIAHTINKTPKGYRMVETPLTHKATWDGKPDKFSRAYEGVPLDSILDRSGRTTAIDGRDEVARKLKRMPATTPAEQQKKSSMLDSLKGAVTESNRHWRNGVGSLIGRKVHVGDLWTASEEVTIWRGVSVHASVKVWIAEAVVRDGRQYLRVVRQLQASPAEFAAELQRSINRTERQQRSKTKITSATIVDERITLLAPDGMTVYSDEHTRDLKCKFASDRSKWSYSSRFSDRSTCRYAKRKAVVHK